MTAIAPHMTAYLRQRLPVERAASQHTCDTYAYAFQILLDFASHKLAVPPSALQLEHLDAPLVLEFLEHLQTRAWQRATHPQRSADRDQVLHALCRASRPGRARADQSRPRHSQSARPTGLWSTISPPSSAKPSSITQTPPRDSASATGPCST